MKYNNKKNLIMFDNNFEFQMLKAIIKHSGGDFRKVIARKNVSKKVN